MTSCPRVCRVFFLQTTPPLRTTYVFAIGWVLESERRPLAISGPLPVRTTDREKSPLRFEVVFSPCDAFGGACLQCFHSLVKIDTQQVRDFYRSSSTPHAFGGDRSPVPAVNREPRYRLAYPR